MLFVLDVGNTNTVLGVFEQGELKHEWRIKTDRHKTGDEYGVLIKSLFDYKELTFSDIDGVIISSVVPPIMLALEEMCHLYFRLEPFIVGRETARSTLKMSYPNPNEIGADRIVNAVGGIKIYGAPLIIIDFGTATTFCYINDQEEYVGGIISPGINVSMEALYSKASKLPKIEIQAPDNVIGTSTVEAMQSGVFNGYVAQVEGIIARMKQQMNTNPKVIATGGLAALIGDTSESIDHVDTYLTLKGLNLIYQMYTQT
ncbi:type III pantothenate kinase [Virgibacillus sp. NKC19-3]|uniref:type III pantothenate kinase n=1 Tax=Virgibacillus saliphilus TaxID=2831674 RepID=UPI001C9B53F3|nr:type III pantothenate kinase [Virgibacillus sp. NKC19-3]MBY7141646.1 type III pantothenate kinase [Virgibacillus sp. NKC19-3]